MNRLARLLRHFFRLQAQQVRTRLRANPFATVSLSHWTHPMTAALAPLLLPLAVRSGRATLRRLVAHKRGRKDFGDPPRVGTGFAVLNNRVVEFIRTWTYAFCDSTNETSQHGVNVAVALLRQELAEGLSRGETQMSLTRRVAKIFHDPQRAHTIAATEVARATAGGQVLAARESGVVRGLRWLASSDACFRAGSLVLKVEGCAVRPVGIETLREGDMVIGGSGRPRRVLGVKATPYQGVMVEGPGFSATPDHPFLGADWHWRPIGEYLSEAHRRIALDFIVTEADDVPPALAQIVRLPTILAGDLGFVVPVATVTENDEMEGVDDEIDKPATVHGNLFTERDAVVGEQFGHRDFDISSFSSSLVGVDQGAMPRAAVDAPSSFACDSTGILGEMSATACADARDTRFPVSVGGATHALSMGDVGARTRTERLSLLSACVPSGSEDRAALPAFGVSEHRDGWIGLQSLILALAATEPSSTFCGPWRDGVRLMAERASQSGSVAGPIRPMTPLAAKLIGALVPSEELATASYAGDLLATAEFVVASEAAMSAFSAAFGQEPSTTGEASAFFHTPIVSHLRLQTSPFRGQVYDIEVEDDHCFALACGLIAHNCPRCLALDGKEVPLGEPFAVDPGGGPYAVITHNPRHPLCQCTVVEVLA